MLPIDKPMVHVTIEFEDEMTLMLSGESLRVWESLYRQGQYALGVLIAQQQKQQSESHEHSEEQEAKSPVSLLDIIRNRNK